MDNSKTVAASVAQLWRKESASRARWATVLLFVWVIAVARFGFVPAVLIGLAALLIVDGILMYDFVLYQSRAIRLEYDVGIRKAEKVGAGLDYPDPPPPKQRPTEQD